MRTGTPPMWMCARSSGMEDDDTVPVAMPYREALPEGDEKVEAVRSMFDAIAPRYDLVNRIMTFRMDVRWRRRTVRTLALPGGATVIDLACGTGDLCRELAEQQLAPIGVDLSFGMLAAARCSRSASRSSSPPPAPRRPTPRERGAAPRSDPPGRPGPRPARAGRERRGAPGAVARRAGRPRRRRSGAHARRRRHPRGDGR